MDGRPAVDFAQHGKSASGDFVTLGFFVYFIGAFWGALAEATVAALASLEVGDGFEEVDAAEVGPEALGDEDLGVGDLPKQIVR
jgi:hypothetical protein